MGVTIQQSQETITADTRPRQCIKRPGKKMEILGAPGFWPDGRREMLAWQIADREDQNAWEGLVHRLWARGCCPEKSLSLIGRDGSGGLGEAFVLVDGTTVREQRCLFHTLQHVSTKARGERKGKENQERRKHLMEPAAAISRTDTALQACMRRAPWAEQWRLFAPQVVATLERDGDQALVFSQVTGIDLTRRRTTSAQERLARECCRTMRQVVAFGRRQGAETAISLHVCHLHARLAGRNLVGGFSAGVL